MVTVTYNVGRWRSNGRFKVTQGTFKVRSVATWDEVAEHLSKLMTKQYSKCTLMSWSSSETLLS